MRLGTILRNKYYLAFIGVAVGLFLYAGLTGNYGIIPKIQSPFGQSSTAPDELLAAPMLLADNSGPAGITVRQLTMWMEKVGAHISWERGAGEASWIMRYAMRNELTSTDFDGALRVNLLVDASFAGINGRAVSVTGWAEDGRELTLAERYMNLLNLAGAIRQGSS